MRPGRAGDLPAVLGLWRADVLAGRRDCVPGPLHLSRYLGDFDWGARSRVDEGGDGSVMGAVLVSARQTEVGTVTQVDVSVRAGAADGLRNELLRWGLGISRAGGAVAAQVWCGRGHSQDIAALGASLVRPFWRMDRGVDAVPEPIPVRGYTLTDGAEVPVGGWAGVHNRAFADHWRFSPRSEAELMTGRAPHLRLMVRGLDGSPAALTVSQIEAYDRDPRPQPVGVVSSVGTVPEHRRRGLATWLVGESLRRLKESGACSYSLYVDGLSQTRAFDAYAKLGFQLAFEAEVWEATLQ